MTFEDQVTSLAKKIDRALKEKDLEAMLYFSVRLGEIVTNAALSFKDENADQVTPKVINPAVNILRRYLRLESFSDPDVLSLCSNLNQSFVELNFDDGDNCLYNAGASSFKLISRAMDFQKNKIVFPEPNKSNMIVIKEKIQFLDKFTPKRKEFESAVSSLDESIETPTESDQGVLTFTTTGLREYSDIYYCKMLKEPNNADKHGRMFKRDCRDLLDAADEHLGQYPEWKRSVLQLTGVIVGIVTCGLSFKSKVFKDTFFKTESKAQTLAHKVKQKAIKTVEYHGAKLA